MRIDPTALADQVEGTVVLLLNEAPVPGELQENVMVRRVGRWWVAGKAEPIDPVEFEPAAAESVGLQVSVWVLPRP